MESLDYTKALLATGLNFGNEGEIPWLVATGPLHMRKETCEKIEDICGACGMFLDTIARAIAENDPVGNMILALLGKEERRKELMRTLKHQPLIPFRPDIVFGKDGRMRVVELETMVGGLGLLAALQVVYGNETQPKIARVYAEMIRRARKKQSASEELRVAVVIPEEKAHYDNEFWVLAKYLLPYNIDLQVCRPPEITWGNRPGKDGGKRESFDIIHRFFRMEEIRKGYPDLLDDMIRATVEERAQMMPPWKEILEEKALLALLHDPALTPFWIRRMGKAAFNLLCDVVPPTWIISERNEELVKALMNSSATEREFWLKQSVAWGGRAAFYGPSMSSTAWKKLLERALCDAQNGNHWIIQRHRGDEAMTVPHLDNGEERKNTPMFVRVTPYAFPTGDPKKPVEMAGTLVTARASSPKVHGAKDAAITLVEAMSE